MAYREPARMEREVVLTARRAIMDLYDEFNGVWDAGPEAMLAHIRKLSTPEGESSPNQILRMLRMFVRNGHAPEALTSAVVALQEAGAFEKAKARQTNPYADELVRSGWGYPSSYAPMPLFKQAEESLKYHRGLTSVSRPTTAPLAVDGFTPIAVPKLSAVAKRLSVASPFGAGYETVVQRLADEVRCVYRQHGFDFAKTPLDLRDFTRLEPFGSVRDALMKLEGADPKSDFMVLHAQMGVRWRGSSMRRVRWHCENADFEPAPGYREFVLPLYVILEHLLLHPKRLMDMAALAIHVAGDHAARKGIFGHDGIGLAFGHGVMHLADYSPSKPDVMFGVPTGLVPK